MMIRHHGFSIANRLTKQPVADSATIFKSAVQISGRKFHRYHGNDPCMVSCIYNVKIINKINNWTINNFLNARFFNYSLSIYYYVKKYIIYKFLILYGKINFRLLAE